MDEFAGALAVHTCGTQLALPSELGAIRQRRQIPACSLFSVTKKSLQIIQVLGKTLRCFSVILAFSKSLHESCRLFAFYRRAADFFLFTGGLPRFDSS